MHFCIRLCNFAAGIDSGVGIKNAANRVFPVYVEASLLNYLFLFFQLLLDRDVTIQIQCISQCGRRYLRVK